MVNNINIGRRKLRRKKCRQENCC